MANIPLSSITTAATALSNLVLVTPQSVKGYVPQSKPVKNGQPKQNADALLFHYEGENAVSLESDITDHYVEDNTAVADQIALRPETITVSGFIGELNNIPPAVLEPLREAAERLTVIGAYTPVLSATAIRAYNQALLLYSVGDNALDSAVAAWNTISGKNSNQVTPGNPDNAVQNEQQKAFNQFYGYRQSRTLFTVQTPWAIFVDMAIQSLQAVQDAETKMISGFEIMFKKIRFTSTIAMQNKIPKTLESRASIQDSGVVDFGTSTPPETTPLSTKVPR